MADYVFLPATTYRTPSPSQDRRKGSQLNTIMEEESEDLSPRQGPGTHWKRAGGGPQLKLEQWLSPMSDHFPTPRGFHFLAAPILPSSPSATSADEEGSSPVSSSSQPSDPWKRASVMTDATEFDDLYDVSDDEERRREKLHASGISRRRDSRKRLSRPSFDETRRALPQLIIPSDRDVSSAENWSGRGPDLKKITSPVAPTPPAQVAMSPAMMTFMQQQHALEVPTISAPPSLDGSLSSDQMAQMSAPPTPVIGGKDEEDQDWSGVQLQPGALATLRALSRTGSDIDFEEQPEQVIEVPQEEPQPAMEPQPPESEPQPPTEMLETRRRPLRLITNIQRASMILSPAQRRSLMGLTKLDIPSPGGFFSGLSPRSRHTWHLPGMTPADEVPPPTSGTAEQFYKLPWNAEAAPPLPPALQRPVSAPQGSLSSSPIEQIVEVRDTRTDDILTALRVQPTPEPVTARPVLLTQTSHDSSATLAETSSSPVEDVTATEIVANCDPVYARKQQEIALSHLDRTEMWLMAQRAYLNGIFEVKEPQEEATAAAMVAAAAAEAQRIADESEEPPAVPPKDKEPEAAANSSAIAAAAATATATATATLTRKKTVRFSEIIKSPSMPRSLPSKLLHQESAYYRAFTDFIVRSQYTDVFTNRLPRFEALQAQRVSLREAHRNQLLGKYQLSVVPQSAKKRMSANVVRGDDVIIDDPEKLRADKEADALGQMAMATWHVAALKMLNGGRLIAAPVHKRLARLSRMAPGKDGVCRDRARILDLGGQATCDWAWHAALQYPNTKIYTVTTKAVRQLSNANIRGPPNHRQVAVERVTKLPFADDQFDLIRASELHSMLKFVGENGEDEWENCLKECKRVLKPGGYLEFSVLDSDMMNAGPLGNARSVEFGFTLRTLGYDPSPTKMFLGRLQRAGFDETRRAWLCLPVGPKPAALKRLSAAGAGASAPLDPETGLPVHTVRLEAIVTGSTDGVAAVTGLAAGWSWERWLLRAETEKVAGELRLADTVTTGDALREAGKGLDAVHAIVEEGRACGAGWRVLRGYTRKPRPGMGTINMVLDTSS